MGRWIERNGKAQPRCHRYTELAIACKSMYVDFKFHLSKPRTSLQAYIDFKFHISKPRTSSQAYFDLKLPFHSLSQKNVNCMFVAHHGSSKLLIITKTTSVLNAGRTFPYAGESSLQDPASNPIKILRGCLRFNPFLLTFPCFFLDATR